MKRQVSTLAKEISLRITYCSLIGQINQHLRLIERLRVIFESKLSQNVPPRLRC
jgi:hypothetical protein